MAKGIRLEEHIIQTIETPNIVDYHDYRQFIQDWIQYLVKSDRSFSIASLSKRSDVSQDYIELFLEGKTAFTTHALGRMLPFLSFNSFEKNYLKLLRRLSETENQVDRLAALDRLRELQTENVHANEGALEEHKYLSRWYFVAIREMSFLPDFEPSADWIQDRLRLRVPREEIENALHYLQQNNLLGTQKELNANGGAYRLAMGQFHHEMLGLAQDAILTVPRKQRGIMAQTIAMDQDCVNEAKQIFAEAMSKINGLATKQGKRETVYHFEVALFPLTQPQTKRAKYVKSK